MSDSSITPNLVSSPSASALSSNQTEEGRASVVSSNAFTMKQALRTAKQRHLSSQPESANEQRLTKEIEMITKQVGSMDSFFRLVGRKLNSARSRHCLNRGMNCSNSKKLKSKKLQTNKRKCTNQCSKLSRLMEIAPLMRIWWSL